MKRLAEMQDCPLFWVRDVVATWAALARSAEGITTNASRAAELEHDLLEGLAGGASHGDARALAAGQRGGGDPGVTDDRVHLAAADEQRLEHVVGEARVPEQRPP